MHDVLVDGVTTMIGGNFFSSLNLGRRSIAVLQDPPPAAVDHGGRAGTVRLGSPFPQPVRDHVTLTLELPRAEEVTCDVLDVAGRPVATPIDRRMMAPGRHEVGIRTRELAAGVFVVRLRAGGETATRKLVTIE